MLNGHRPRTATVVAPTLPDDLQPAGRHSLLGPWRLAAVAIVAIGGFAAGLTRFPDAQYLACTMSARADAAYSAQIFLPPSMSPMSQRLFIARQSQGVAVRISVSRDQKAVSQGRVCVDAFPVNKAWLGVSDEAHLVAPGQYEVLLGFDPPGAWYARVVVVEPHQQPVSIPVNFTVPFPPPAIPSTTLP